jgi:hypothetical protein
MLASLEEETPVGHPREGDLLGRRFQSRRRTAIAAVSFALLGSMCVSASASATFYASPAGGAAAVNCQSPAGPYCSITEATTNVMTTGADIVLTPGNYVTGSTTVAITNRTVHGQAAQPSATITSTSGLAVDVQSFGQLSDVRIEDNAGTALRQYGTTSVSDRIFAHTTGGAFACDLIAGTLRDSVCWNTNPADFSAGLGTATGGSPATVRNVTAVATATPNSFGIRFQGSFGTSTMSASDVIADGASIDVSALNSATATTVTLDHSDYANEQALAGASVTPHGSGTNITAAPLFANSSTGDFHQVASSPTINTGVMDGSSGTTDLDGVAWGGAYDIGAYKFVPLPPPDGGGSTPPAGVAPTTTPSAKKCKKRKHRAAASKKCKKRRK